MKGFGELSCLPGTGRERYGKGIGVASWFI